MGRGKTRVPVAGSPSGLTSNPFGSMNLDGLPAGPADSPAVPASTESVKGRVVLRREKSRRGGKTVVVASGFDARISVQELDDLARKARQDCGCGGTRRDREVEMQGDIAHRVRAFFEKLGFRVAGEG